MTLVSFSLLSFGSFFFFVFRTTQLAIHLSWRFDIECSAAAFTLFLFAAAYLGVQIKICRQHTPQEVIAVDPAAGDELHTAMLISVIQQQAVPISVVAAALQQRLNAFILLRLYSDYNFHSSFVMSGS